MKLYHVLLFSLLCVLLSACTTSTPGVLKDSAPKQPIDVSHVKDAIPKHESPSRYGNPSSYVVNGQRYYVLPTSKNYKEKGVASWYGTKFHGRLTSTREAYDMLAMTAASPVLPLPTYARVTNLNNGKSVVVRVNDRGPFAPGRIIDLSYTAAKKLGYAEKGTAYVEVTALPMVFDSVAPDSYYLQVGAFSVASHANRYQQQLKQLLQAPVRVLSKHTHHTIFYVVRVGPVESSHSLRQVRSVLQARGISSILIQGNQYVS